MIKFELSEEDFENLQRALVKVQVYEKNEGETIEKGLLNNLSNQKIEQEYPSLLGNKDK